MKKRKNKKIENKKTKQIIKIFIIILIIYNILSVFNYDFNFFGIIIMNVKRNQEQENLKEDTIIIAKKTKEDLQIGDLVVVNISDSTYFHRIINIENDYITTKGDGNFKDDNILFEKQDVQYKVMLKIPYLGIVFKIADNKIFSVIICVILVMYYTYSKKIDKKNLIRRRKKLKSEEK